ncbi:MAG: DoxX family protein [Thioalkalivibrio sp.]|nr:DoxX family protein [Thioalkalivibrio sp.]
MSFIAVVAQIVIALGIFNVWILRRDRPTGYRPEGARSIAEEFERYGFPDWVRVVVGSTKLALAAALLVGVVYAQVALPAAVLMGVLMLGAVAAHVRVRDPLVKSLPALGMLLLSGVVVVAYLA